MKEKDIKKLHQKFNRNAAVMKKAVLGKDFEEKLKDRRFQRDVLSFFRIEPVKSIVKRAEFKKDGKKISK